ncbi:MAG: hypothetical protein Ta2E_10040 [Mycoplasmoidaceae bacterium]|nr:MAG: hypothetical protein Ta2E_10040 [Mycoplasmoidaceae bacterium]
MVLSIWETSKRKEMDTGVNRPGGDNNLKDEETKWFTMKLTPKQLFRVRTTMLTAPSHEWLGIQLYSVDYLDLSTEDWKLRMSGIPFWFKTRSTQSECKLNTVALGWSWLRSYIEKISGAFQVGIIERSFANDAGGRSTQVTRENRNDQTWGGLPETEYTDWQQQ